MTPGRQMTGEPGGRQGGEWTPAVTQTLLETHFFSLFSDPLANFLKQHNHPVSQRDSDQIFALYVR